MVFTVRRPDVSLHESGVADTKPSQLFLDGVATPALFGFGGTSIEVARFLKSLKNK